MSEFSGVKDGIYFSVNRRNIGRNNVHDRQYYRKTARHNHEPYPEPLAPDVMGFYESVPHLAPAPKIPYVYIPNLAPDEEGLSLGRKPLPSLMFV